MKWLVSFRKLKISSGLEFLKRSFKLFGNFLANLSKPVTVYEHIWLKGTLHVEHTGGGFPLLGANG